MEAHKNQKLSDDVICAVLHLYGRPLAESLEKTVKSYAGQGVVDRYRDWWGEQERQEILDAIESRRDVAIPKEEERTAALQAAYEKCLADLNASKERRDNLYAKQKKEKEELAGYHITELRLLLIRPAKPHVVSKRVDPPAGKSAKRAIDSEDDAPKKKLKARKAVGGTGAKKDRSPANSATSTPASTPASTPVSSPKTRKFPQVSQSLSGEVTLELH